MKAVKYCRRHDISVIAGACPMMHGDGVNFGHTCMRWILRISADCPRKLSKAFQRQEGRNGC